jgi:hypothetical protein
MRHIPLYQSASWLQLATGITPYLEVPVAYSRVFVANPGNNAWPQGACTCCRDAAKATTYSYSDLMRDMDREIESWQRERQKKKGKRAEDLSDVMGDIAEEFLEFLEMGAGIDLGGKPKKDSGAAPPLLTISIFADDVVLLVHLLALSPADEPERTYGTK